jgi:hypothetical protein
MVASLGDIHRRRVVPASSGAPMSEPKLRVLMVHNDYQAGSPSGENASFRDESELLSSRGHRVVPYTRCSDEIRTYSPWQRLVLAKNAGWSSDTRAALLRLTRETRPDVAHFQNIFPLISPSAIALVKRWEFLSCRHCETFVCFAQRLRFTGTEVSARNASTGRLPGLTSCTAVIMIRGRSRPC